MKFSDYDKKGTFSLERYIAAHTIMISFEGIPAIYFNSLFGTSNDEAKFIITGNNRDVNRYKWNLDNIDKKLKNKKSKQSIIFNKLINLLRIRRNQKAFHPNAIRYNLKFGSKIFSFKRVSKDKKQTIICISNLSSSSQNIRINRIYHKWKNLIGSKIIIKKNLMFLKPYESIWLSNK